MELVNLLKDISLEYKIVLCDTEYLIRHCKELRHFVYCTEKGWEPENTAKIEEDEFDLTSIHYLILRRETNIYIGTFRLIVSKNLPLNAYMPPDHIFHPKYAPTNSVCEVSRFSIVKEYRCVKLLKILFLIVGYESSKHKFIGSYMVMERSLAILLIRNKINCRQITKSFLLNGSRAIYFCSVVDSLNSLGLTLNFDKNRIDSTFLPLYENIIPQVAQTVCS